MYRTIGTRNSSRISAIVSTIVRPKAPLAPLLSLGVGDGVGVISIVTKVTVCGYGC